MFSSFRYDLRIITLTRVCLFSYKRKVTLGCHESVYRIHPFLGYLSNVCYSHVTTDIFYRVICKGIPVLTSVVLTTIIYELVVLMLSLLVLIVLMYVVQIGLLGNCIHLFYCLCL